MVSDRRMYQSHTRKHTDGCEILAAMPAGCPTILPSAPRTRRPDSLGVAGGLLGALLTGIEFFGSPEGNAVHLGRSSRGYVVSFALDGGAWDTPEIEEGYRAIGRYLAESRLGKPLTISLRDLDFNERARIVIE